MKKKTNVKIIQNTILKKISKVSPTPIYKQIKLFYAAFSKTYRERIAVTLILCLKEISMSIIKLYTFLRTHSLH